MGGLHHLLAMSPRVKQTVLLDSQQESDLIGGGKAQNPLLKDRKKVQAFLQVRPSKEIHPITLRAQTVFGMHRDLRIILCISLTA